MKYRLIPVDYSAVDPDRIADRLEHRDEQVRYLARYLHISPDCCCRDHDQLEVEAVPEEGEPFLAAEIPGDNPEEVERAKETLKAFGIELPDEGGSDA